MERKVLTAFILLFFLFFVPEIKAWSGGCSAWRDNWVPIYYTDQYCCPGWTHNGNQACTIPICYPTCKNGGSCINPNVCACRDAYTGPTCETPQCSYLYPCYPGDCALPNNCTCLKGFGGTPSLTVGCRDIISDDEKPQLGRVVAILANMKRIANAPDELKYEFVTDATNKNETEMIWSNQATFNLLSFEFESIYMTPNGFPAKRPVYVSDYGIGIVKGSIHVNLTKIPRDDGPIRDVHLVQTYNCSEFSYLTPILNSAAKCYIKDDQFSRSISNGDWLTVTFQAENGGFRTRSNTDMGILLSPDRVMGKTDRKRVEFRFDFEAAIHCSEKNGTCQEKPLAIKEDITKKQVEISWGGWSDALSGMWRYYLEIFKLSPDPYARLVETEPLKPIYTQFIVETGPHYTTYTPKEPGMYSVLLEARDMANNSKIARRLCLYDNVSTVEIDTSDEHKIYVSTATNESGYLWQASPDVITVVWSGHFLNRIHRENKLLNQVLMYPIQFSKVQEDGILSSRKYVFEKLDDEEGMRSLREITNFNGIVRFEVIEDLTDGAQLPITGWKDVSPLAENYTFQTNLSNGRKLKVWVRAHDVMGNIAYDFTELRIDGTPPMVGIPEFQRNYQNGTYKHCSRFTFLASDDDSGVYTLEYKLVINITGEVKHTGKIYANFIVGGTACLVDPQCRCRDNICFKANQVLDINNCWFLAKPDILKYATMTVQIFVRNRAGVSWIFSQEVNELYRLSGLTMTPTTMNITTSNEEPNGVRLNWELPDSCYGETDILIEIVETGTKYRVNNQSHFIDVLELGEGKTYTAIFSMVYRNEDLGVNISYTFTTTLATTSPAPTAALFTKPVVQPKIELQASGGGRLVFYCGFQPLTDRSDSYKVTWHRDRIEAGTIIKLTQTVYLTEVEFRSITSLSEIYISLGTTYFCTVTSNKFNVMMESDPFLAGILVISDDPIVIRNSDEALLKIRSNLPFACLDPNEDCFLDVDMFYIEQGADSCLLPAAVAISHCGIRISSQKWNETYPIRISTQHGQNLQSLSRTYNIILKTSLSFVHHTLFQNYMLPRKIKIEVNTDASFLRGKECHAVCDPHMLTFDGRHYENQNRGTYILYQHTVKPVQVQIVSKSCYGFREGPPFCPCAVAVMAGKDVFVVDQCSKPIRIYMPLCEDSTLKDSIKNDGNSYQVYLPTGAWVKITTGISFNIYIYPSVLDRTSSSGLCGYLDNNVQNDFMLRNGSYVPGEQFELFNANWLVLPEENLFNISNYASLRSWKRDEYLCLCSQIGLVGQSESCNPDTRKLCNDSNLTDSLAAHCERQMGSNLLTAVELDAADAGPGMGENDFVMENQTNYTEDTARQECWSQLNRSMLFRKCSEVPDIDPESFVNTCVQDALITKTMFWVSTHLESARKSCLYQVTVNQVPPSEFLEQLNVTRIKNTTEGTMNKTKEEAGAYNEELLQDVMNLACLMNCSGQGNCIRGACQCKNGYGDVDCSVDLNKPPEVYGIPNRGVCDLQKSNCEKVSVLGNNFVDSESFACQLFLFQIKLNETIFHDNTLVVFKAKRVSFAEATCSIVDVRFKRSVEFQDDVDTLAIGYRVAIGNTHQRFSRNVSVLIIDSLCVDCYKSGFSIRCSKKEGFDLVNRRCTKSNVQKTQETGWSIVYTVIVAVVGSVVLALVVVVILLCLRGKMTKRATNENNATVQLDMQNMENRVEDIEIVEDVYQEINDQPATRSTKLGNPFPTAEPETGHSTYMQLTKAEKDASDGYSYLNKMSDTIDGMAKPQLPERV